MTVANIIFEPNRIRMVTDTLGYRNKAPADFSRKVNLAPAAGTVFIVRGYRAIATQLAEDSRDWKSHAAALSDLEKTLREMPQRLLTDAGAEVTVAGCEGERLAVTRFGISKSAGDVVVRRFDLKPGVYLAPTLGAHDIPANMSEDQLLRVALLQQEIALRHNLNMCVGGDVELTTIEVGQPITVRKLGEYPNKAFTAREISRRKPAPAGTVAA